MEIVFKLCKSNASFYLKHWQSKAYHTWKSCFCYLAEIARCFSSKKEKKKKLHVANDFKRWIRFLRTYLDCNFIEFYRKIYCNNSIYIKQKKIKKYIHRKYEKFFDEKWLSKQDFKSLACEGTGVDKFKFLKYQKKKSIHLNKKKGKCDVSHWNWIPFMEWVRKILIKCHPLSTNDLFISPAFSFKFCQFDIVLN